MNIVQKTSTIHTGHSAGRPIQYIVLHYTAGTSSKSGVARNIASMFANPNNRAASADFIIDDAEIVQYNGDIRNRYTYAVGGDRYSVKYTKESGLYYGKCKNFNSISIEMCSSKTNKKSLGATDTDWYLTDAVVSKAVELTKYLMKTYGVPAERVIMHHHVTGKLCPQPWCINEAALKHWYAFKARLTGASSGQEQEPAVRNVNYSVKVSDASGLNCRSGVGTSYGIVMTYAPGTVLPISKESEGWGYTGKGWVNLAYTEKYVAAKEDEIDMTAEQFLSEVFTKMSNEQAYQLYTKAMNHASTMPSSQWAVNEGHWSRAMEKGVVDGSAPQRPATREQFVTVLGRLGLI